MMGKLVFKSGTMKALSKILLCLSSLFSSVLVFPSLSVQEWRLPETRTALFLRLCVLGGSDSFPTFNLFVSHSIRNLIHTTSSSYIHALSFSLLLLHILPFLPTHSLFFDFLVNSTPIDASDPKLRTLLSGFAWTSRMLMWVTFKMLGIVQVWVKKSHIG